jgi:hypothetical protein
MFYRGFNTKKLKIKKGKSKERSRNRSAEQETKDRTIRVLSIQGKSKIKPWKPQSKSPVI